MNSLLRLLGFSLLLLLAFLAAAGGAQLWLRSQHDRLQASAIEGQRRQFASAIDLLPAPGPGGYVPGDALRLGALLGAEVTFAEGTGPDPGVERGGPHFSVRLPTGQYAVVTFPTPPADRLLFLHQRTVIALLLFAFALVALLVVVLLMRPPMPAESNSRPPWGFAQAEMHNLEHLARTSLTQGAELARERDVRQRAEQDAYFNQVRLNQALEEKIRLGRDLHDGIIQSLYATGLTLENARDLITGNPAEAARRLQGSIDLLNVAIREVRNYITGLEASHGRDTAFSQIVARLAEELRAGRDAGFEFFIDDTAAALLDERTLAEVAQIVREAISNALRHGGASHIIVRLHEGDGAVAVLVQDDGSGFATNASGPRGHGLANMRGRAESAGGSLQVESTPGHGTRIVLTLPVATLS